MTGTLMTESVILSLSADMAAPVECFLCSGSSFHASSWTPVIHIALDT